MSTFIIAQAKIVLTGETPEVEVTPGELCERDAQKLLGKKVKRKDAEMLPRMGARNTADSPASCRCRILNKINSI
jgi:hypothetical protein